MNDTFLPGSGFDTYESQDKVLIQMADPAACAVCEDAIYAASTAHKAGFTVLGVQDAASADDAPAMAQVCDQFLPDWTALDWAKI